MFDKRFVFLAANATLSESSTLIMIALVKSELN